MLSRRKARIYAFQAIYQWDIKDMDSDEAMSFDWLESQGKSLSDEDLIFPRFLIVNFIENKNTVDETLKQHLDKWQLERLAKVDLAILRSAITEILYNKDLDPKIAINEAVGIAKEYASSESYRFINGVLDSVVKKRSSNMG